MDARKPLTLHRLREMHAVGIKLAMLTCYDALFARLLDGAGVDVLLVGDSLGMVLQGHTTTLSVSMQEMIYHTACVARGNQTAWIIADMPFGSYQKSPQQAFQNAARVLAETGCAAVKLEGGTEMADTIRLRSVGDGSTWVRNNLMSRAEPCECPMKMIGLPWLSWAR